MANILLIDDDDVFGDLTQRRLAKVGHEVTYQSRTEGAVPLVSSGKFDVILLDLGMPGLSGEELLGVMKTTGLLETTRVIVYSSSDAERLERLGREFGVLPLGKDASADELRAMVDRALEKET